MLQLTRLPVFRQVIIVGVILKRPPVGLLTYQKYADDTG